MATQALPPTGKQLSCLVHKPYFGLFFFPPPGGRAERFVHDLHTGASGLSEMLFWNKEKQHHADPSTPSAGCQFSQAEDSGKFSSSTVSLGDDSPPFTMHFSNASAPLDLVESLTTLYYFSIKELLWKPLWLWSRYKRHLYINFFLKYVYTFFSPNYCNHSSS